MNKTYSELLMIGLALGIAAPAVRAQTLEAALDAPGVVWTTSVRDGFGSPTTGGEWAGQTGITHDGVDAARSGPLPPFPTARLRTESLAGGGTVTFWRRQDLLGGQQPFLAAQQRELDRVVSTRLCLAGCEVDTRPWLARARMADAMAPEPDGGGLP